MKLLGFPAKHSRTIGGPARPGGGGGYELYDTFSVDLITTQVSGSFPDIGRNRVLMGTGSQTVNIANGVLNMTTGSAIQYGQPGIWYNHPVTRVNGKIFSAKHKKFTSAGFMRYGWTSAIGGAILHGFNASAGNLRTNLSASVVTIGGMTFTATEEYYFAFILRSAGCLLFVKGGPEYPLWTLANEEVAGNTTPVYPSIQQYNLPFEADNVKIPVQTWSPAPLFSDSFSNNTNIIPDLGPNGLHVTGTLNLGFTSEGAYANGATATCQIVNRFGLNWNPSESTIVTRIRHIDVIDNIAGREWWRIQHDPSNLITLQYSGITKKFSAIVILGGVSVTVFSDVTTFTTNPLSFSTVIVTISKSNNRIRTYVDGALQSSTAPHTGTYSGSGLVSSANVFSGGGSPALGTVSHLICAKTEIQQSDVTSITNNLTLSNAQTIFGSNLYSYHDLTNISSQFLSDGLGHPEANGGSGIRLFGPGYHPASGGIRIQPAITKNYNQVSTGTFGTAEGWTLGTNWSIAGGAAYVSGTSSGALVHTSGTAIDVNSLYRLDYDIVNYITGSNVNASVGGTIGQKRSANGSYVDILLPTGTLSCRFTPGAEMQIMGIDNVMLTKIMWKDTFATYNFGVKDILIAAQATLWTVGYMGGFVIALDSQTNPRNFVLCYFNANSAGTRQMGILKMVNGVISNVGPETTIPSYSVSNYFKLIKRGNQYNFYHPEATEILISYTISDASIINNTIHGIFGTSVQVTLDNLRIYSLGENNEYGALSTILGV